MEEPEAKDLGDDPCSHSIDQSVDEPLQPSNGDTEAAVPQCEEMQRSPATMSMEAELEDKIPSSDVAVASVDGFLREEAEKTVEEELERRSIEDYEIVAGLEEEERRSIEEEEKVAVPGEEGRGLGKEDGEGAALKKPAFDAAEENLQEEAVEKPMGGEERSLTKESEKETSLEPAIDAIDENFQEEAMEKPMGDETRQLHEDSEKDLILEPASVCIDRVMQEEADNMDMEEEKEHQLDERVPSLERSIASVDETLQEEAERKTEGEDEQWLSDDGERALILEPASVPIDSVMPEEADKMAVAEEEDQRQDAEDKKGPADETMQEEAVEKPKGEEEEQLSDDESSKKVPLSEPVADDDLLQEDADKKVTEEEEQQLEADDEQDPALESVDAAANDDDGLPEEAEEMAVDDVGPVTRASKRGLKRKKGGVRAGRGGKARTPSKPKEDEDLCFICFDGGDLVVCDHRGCPKVYHPSCVNRDEAYFRAKGQWNCGWHICSNCQKSARYMCYTCTYSLCKGCIKEAEFICVRGNKGFCVTCMKTVMLIEKNERADEDMVGVDFNDKSSWLYLFKDYWLDLKAKLSLTLQELERARTPLKESTAFSHNEEPLNVLDDANDGRGASSSSSSGYCKESSSLRKTVTKVKKRLRKASSKDGPAKKVEVEGSSIPEDVEWATKELLEFVAHMKAGDVSVLSQFDVQALVLDYIKGNNLRDPRRKSQIICDSRLQTLFGKPRVGHLEMLKLIDSHFLIKEASPLATDDNQGGVVDPDPNQMDAVGNSDGSVIMAADKRRKTRGRVEQKEPTNLAEYAAIDVHNVNLMYLRRNLMEDLIDDADMFHENVVGSFVRIRISGSGQKQDMYRLVQVVGTGKAAEKYKTGKRSTDITLEILNLDKREVITIDIISNQDFTEEECERLRQSIKCGFIDRLTVGEVREKARALQTVRVNDWLESEKLRLGHLRDRASEKGRRKELRECVEKLQLLSTPEEHMRRLNEVPEIHVDPNMDPDHESAEDEEDLNAKKQVHEGYYSRPRGSSSRGREVLPVGKGGSTAWKDADTTWGLNRSAPMDIAGDVGSSIALADRTNALSGNQGKDVHQINSPIASKIEVNATGLDAGVLDGKQQILTPEQPSGVPPENKAEPTVINNLASMNTSDAEKLWHYQDPSGKVQGPFSMAQLKKWNTTGYFPVNLRIWRVSEKHEDSILLTDALNGKFHKDLPQQQPQSVNTPQPTKGAVAVDTGGSNLEGGQRGTNTSWIDPGFPATGYNSLTNADRWTAQPTSLSVTNTGVVSPTDRKPATLSRGWEAPKDTNAWSGQSQGHNNPRPMSPFSRNSSQPPSHQGREGRGNSGRWNADRGHQNNWNSNKFRRFHPSDRGYERQHPYRNSSSQQFSRDQWKVQQTNASSSQLGCNSYNVPAITSQPNNIDWTSVQGALNKIFPPTTSVQPMSSGLGPNSGGNESHQSPLTTKNSNETLPVMNSVEGWASGSVPHIIPVQFPQNVQYPQSVQFPQNVHALSTCQTSNQEHKPTETVASAISDKPPVFCTFTSTECMGGLEKNHSSESVPNPTPKCKQSATDVLRCEQAATDVLNPDSSQPVHSQLGVVGNSPVSLQATVDPEKSCPEAPSRSASEPRTICVNGRESEPTSMASAALVMTNLPEFASQGSQPSSSPAQGSGSQIQAPVLAQKQGQDSLSVNIAQPPNVGWGVAPQNPNMGTGTPQEIGNMLYGAAVPGGSNMGWGMVAQGIMNMAWGTPANLNLPWGPPAPPNANANLGMPIPPQGSANLNLAWGAQAQGATNPGTGWVAPMQVNPTLNPGLVAPGQGNIQPNIGWVAPSQVNANQNTGWVAPTVGTGQASVDSVRPPWDPSVGNPNNWNAQQEQAGDSQHSLLPPTPNGQRAGVCKFHEYGHCKKGASCNFIHS